ncbi:unnamed protein product [Rotaria sp. Silwood2]|nr:unnamed protein product [Rotaria sp. Silwood2]
MEALFNILYNLKHYHHGWKKSTLTASGSSSSVSLLATTNKPKNSLSVPSSTSGGGTTAGSSEITKNRKINAALPGPMRRILENFLVIWLDANFDEYKDNYKKAIQHLRHNVGTITTFTDADQCVDFLSDIKDEKVFMIVSGALGPYIIPEIQAFSQLDCVYVFGEHQSIHEQWARKIPKVKGIYTQIEPICKALKFNREHCDRSMISISFNGVDALFMYTQLLKETLLEIEDDDTKSIKELVDYCRLQSDASEITLKNLEQGYRHHTAIWCMGDYSKALTSYERSLEIRKIALPPNHPDLAASYLNIGSVYYSMGEYSEALSSYERSLEIQKTTLPQNHPDLAASHNNIGNVYDNMGEHSKALSSYERSLEIQKIVLPPNHPSLATSYNNIGLVYRKMDEYSKALSSYERSLEIREKALPPNHPDFAQSYNNIGLVYRKMGEYSKALSSYKRSLEIREKALPPNHPDLAASYLNIGSIMSINNNIVTAACVFFKAPIRRGSLTTSSERRQDSSSSSDDENQPSASTFCSSQTIKKRPITTNSNHSSNKRKRHQQHIENDNDTNDSITKENFLDVKFKSHRQAQGPKVMGATATIEIDTDKQHDQQSICERAKKINKQLQGKADDKIYRCINNYQQFSENKDTTQRNTSRSRVRNKGPIRAPANILRLLLFVSSYCVFGDSCKFLHGRSDYKHGWQIEREWNEQSYGAVDDDSKRYYVRDKYDSHTNRFHRSRHHHATESDEEGF